MTTTMNPLDVLIQMAEANPVRATHYASKIEAARAGTLAPGMAMAIIRMLGGMSSPADGDTYHAPPSGGGMGFGKAQIKDEATEAQVRYLNSLRVERGSEALTEAAARKLTRKQASAEIDAWRAIPKPRREVVRAAAAPVELEAAMYLVDGKVYKVQKAIHGSGRMYAKRLVVDGPDSAHFEFDGGAIRSIKPEHRMTLEQAQEFGHVYGVCCRCGATLTDETSISAGLGPVCASKM